MQVPFSSQYRSSKPGSGLPWTGKTWGKTKIVQSGKRQVIFFSEKSGNSVFLFIVHKFSSSL